MSGYFARLAQRSGLQGPADATRKPAAVAVPPEVDEVKEVSQASPSSGVAMRESPRPGVAETMATSQMSSVEPVMTDAAGETQVDAQAAIRPESDLDSAPETIRPIEPSPRIETVEVHPVIESATAPAETLGQASPEPPMPVGSDEPAEASTGSRSGDREPPPVATSPGFIRTVERQHIRELREVVAPGPPVSDATPDRRLQPAMSSVAVRSTPKTSPSAEPFGMSADASHSDHADPVKINIGRIQVEVHAPAAKPNMHIAPAAPAAKPRRAKQTSSSGLRRLYLREL